MVFDGCPVALEPGNVIDSDFEEFGLGRDELFYCEYVTHTELMHVECDVKLRLFVRVSDVNHFFADRNAILYAAVRFAVEYCNDVVPCRTREL